MKYIRFCFAEDPGATYLRLTFSFPQEKLIGTGVARLLKAGRQSAAHPATAASGTTGTPPIV